MIAQLGEHIGEGPTIEERDGSEYVISTDSIERLVLDIDTQGRKLSVLYIETRTRGRGAGSATVKGLVELADEHGYKLVAEDVSNKLDPWWRQQGFVPMSEGSADYIYTK